jgi:RNA polymerase sigma-70 factor, ECF subfamily
MGDGFSRRVSVNVDASVLAEPLRSESLVARAQAGDQVAFTRLISERQHEMYRTAWAILRNDQDALDATQDACLAAWRELPSLRDPARFDAWLMRSLVNRCRTALRSRKRVSVREIHLEPIGGPELASGARDIDESFANSDAIRSAFGRLNADQRMYLVLHYVEHRPVAEIAAIVGAPEGTVKWRLSEARRALEKRLAREDR